MRIETNIAEGPYQEEWGSFHCHQNVEPQTMDYHNKSGNNAYRKEKRFHLPLAPEQCVHFFNLSNFCPQRIGVLVGHGHFFQQL